MKILQFTLIFFFAWLLSPTLVAQENLMTNKQAWKSLKSERAYDVFSKFDTVSHNPLLIYGIFGKNGYVGIIDHLGNEITKAEYHMIGGMNLDYTSNMFMLYDHFSVRTKEKYGVLKNTGELVHPLDSGYISMETYSKDPIAKVKRVEMIQRSTRYKKTQLFVDGRTGKKAKYTDDDYKTITLAPVDEFGDVAEKGIKVEVLKDGSDFDGPTDIGKKPKNTSKSPPEIHPVLGKRKGFFSKDHYIYENAQTGKLGIANINNMEMVLPHDYSQIRRFFNGKKEYMFEKDGKQGIIDFDFNIKLMPKWDEVRPFKSNYAVRDGKYFAVLDADFNRLSKFKYQYNQPANHQMGYVAKVLLKDGQEVLLNYLGKEVLKYKYVSYKIPDCRKIEKPVIILQTEEGFKLLDINGVSMLDEVFQSIIPECNVSSEEGHISVAWNMMQNTPNEGFYAKKNGKYGFINSNMQMTIPPSYRSMGESYYDDLIYVRDTNGWGVINSKTGKIVIPLESRICPKGSAGLIRTLNNEGYIYWNKKGEALTSPIKDGAYVARVYHGLYRVTRRGLGAIYFDEEGSRMDTDDTRY